MIKAVLSRAAIKKADKATIEEFGIPEISLMENAGRLVIKSVEKNYGELLRKRVVIVCGKGNNAGDGFVIARALYSKGCSIKVLLLFPDQISEGSTLSNLKLLRTIKDNDLEQRLSIESYKDFTQLRDYKEADFYIDAVFGTGLNRELPEKIKRLVDWFNERKAPKISIDIPSGLNGDDGTIFGACIKADLTITMASLKLGMVLNDGPKVTGQIEVADIGIPQFILDKCAKSDNSAFSLDDETVKNWLPQRTNDPHKYSVGSLLIVAGSKGMTGAATLCSMGAQRIGAGIITCACPESVLPILANKLTEVVTLPLPETSDATIAGKALKILLSKSDKSQSALIGCGLGRNEETQKFVVDFLHAYKKPLVIDADALFALVGSIKQFPLSDLSQGKWILTPHWGEFKRLAGIDEQLNYFARMNLAREKAKEWNCIILLKGMPSLVALPDGRVFINFTGNAAAATAGTGDVLSGLCAGLLAQGLSSEQAALASIYIAGTCADRYIQRFDARTMIASDVIEQLPHVLKERFNF
ncbi:MAG: NAD(P)H-hydrate dehydratase [Candidatus Caenarcaniphilales bacterium]|nr:NAD(P)H-hydrate dehydratase [Candidatus Caenarcaniphilales bacterium]